MLPGKKGLWTCIIQKTRLAYCSKLDKKGNSFNYANNLAHMMLIAWANFFHQILRWYFISRNPQRPNRKCLATCQPMLLHVIWVYLPGNFQSISVPQTTEMALGEIVETLIPTHLQSCCQLCVNGKNCSPAVLIKTLGPGPCVRVLLNPLRGGAPSLSNSSFVCEPGENFNKKLLVPQTSGRQTCSHGMAGSSCQRRYRGSTLCVGS